MLGVLVSVAVWNEEGGPLRGCDGGKRAHICAEGELSGAHESEASITEWSSEPEADVVVVLSGLDVQQVESGVHDEVVEEARDFLIRRGGVQRRM